MSAPAPKRTRMTQAERTATAARRMVRAARKLIARQGYTKTSLAQVGKEAGYTGGLVSHHFGSKEGLLRAVVGNIAGRFYEDQLQPVVSGKTGLDALCAATDTYLAELTVREERMRTLYVLMGESLGPVPEVNPIFAELNRGFREDMKRLIEAGIASGEIRSDLDPDAEAAVAVGMLRGVALQWMAEAGCLDLASVSASVRNTLRRNLSANGRTD